MFLVTPVYFDLHYLTLKLVCDCIHGKHQWPHRSIHA